MDYGDWQNPECSHRHLSRSLAMHATLELECGHSLSNIRCLGSLPGIWPLIDLRNSLSFSTTKSAAPSTSRHNSKGSVTGVTQLESGLARQDSLTCWCRMQRKLSLRQSTIQALGLNTVPILSERLSQSFRGTADFTDDSGREFPRE